MYCSQNEVKIWLFFLIIEEKFLDLVEAEGIR